MLFTTRPSICNCQASQCLDLSCNKRAHVQKVQEIFEGGLVLHNIDNGISCHLNAVGNDLRLESESFSFHCFSHQKDENNQLLTDFGRPHAITFLLFCEPSPMGNNESKGLNLSLKLNLVSLEPDPAGGGGWKVDKGHY